MAATGIEPLAESAGDSYDNALSETIIGLHKTEVIRRNSPWRNLEEVEFATLGWVDWLNNRRSPRADREHPTIRARSDVLC